MYRNKCSRKNLHLTLRHLSNSGDSLYRTCGGRARRSDAVLVLSDDYGLERWAGNHILVVRIARGFRVGPRRFALDEVPALTWFVRADGRKLDLERAR